MKLEAILYLLLLTGNQSDIAPNYPYPLVSGNSVEVVMKTQNHNGFFSLAQYQGIIHAGTYCLNCSGGVDLKNPVTPLNLAFDDVYESLYDLTPDPVSGNLYISAENAQGRVYRWKPGQTSPTEVWRAKNETEWGTLATRRLSSKFENKLVTIIGRFNSSDLTKMEAGFYVLETKIGGSGAAAWSVLGSSHTPNGTFLRDIVEFKGKLLLIGFDYNREVGGWYEPTDSTLQQWQWRDVKDNMRFLRAKVSNGGDKLYIAGSPYSNGQRIPPATLLQTYTTLPSDVTPAWQDWDSEMVFGFDVDPNRRAIYVGAHKGWYSEGEAAIWRYYNGQWTVIARVNEPETPAMLLTSKGLYVATRDGWGYDEATNGKVYLIK
jgi:hypothetical protein